MTLKSLFRRHGYLAVLVLILGCSETNECLFDYERQNFEQAITNCQQRYALKKDLETLNYWAESLGHLGRSKEIPNLLSQTTNIEHLAEVYSVAAKYELRINNLETANDYYFLAADAFRESNMQSELAKTLHKLYFIAWQRSEHKKAIGFATQSLDAAQLANNDADEIVALNDLFTIFQEVGNLGPAQHALSLINTKLGDDQSSPRRINAYISQGLLDMDKKQFGSASHNYDSALAIAKTSKNKDALRGLHLNIVESNLALGRMNKAKTHLEKAWEFARSDGSQRFALLYYQSQYHLLNREPQQAYELLLEAIEVPDLPKVWGWRIHFWAGQAARQLNLKPVALESFNNSIRASESLREEMSLSELKAHSIARRRQPYEALFIEHFMSGNMLDAFTVAEQAKTRSFTDSFIQSSESAMSTGTQATSFQAASDRVESLQLYLQSMSATSTNVYNDSQNIVEAIKQRHLVSFFLAEERLFALRVARDKLDIMEIDIAYEVLIDLIALHRQQPDNKEILSRLGELLFPVSVLPDQDEHLYVSPDALLGNISVASLRVGSNYLIERNTVSLIPSANSMLRITNQFNPANTTENEPLFVVLGDPLNNLPSANQEVRAVSNLLNTQAFVNEAANISNVLRSPNPDLLHIATHSGIDHLGPWISLADGRVPGSTLLRKNLAPRMAVLASCASAAGNDNHVWGSLGGLFLSKGASSVLAALRSVEDRYATKVMLEFYLHVKNQSSSAEALAMSQRAAINRGDPPHLWGAFVLMGEPLRLY